VSERAPRPPWQRFRAALDAAGFRPSKRLGQNFLLDENTARAIVEDAELPPEAHVVEVGPGCGFLSVHLAHAVGRLVCLEVDPRLVPVATEFLEPYPHAEVVEADALAGKHALGPAWASAVPEEGPWHLVANLPYSISAPVLALVAGLERPPQSFTVLVQEELADRLAGASGGPDWGALSVAVQLAYEVRGGRRVPPGAFSPRPRVDSRLAHGRLREDLAPAEERNRVRELAGALLQRRRQMVRRVLGDHLGERARAEACLAEAGIEPEMRVQELDLGAWQRLEAASRVR